MALKLWSGERVVISCWLEGGGYETSMENIERLKPLLVRARNDATRDVEHARADRGPNQDAAAHTPALDFIKAFEVGAGRYSSASLHPQDVNLNPGSRQSEHGFDRELSLY
jgi:hypothetical protein